MSSFRPSPINVIPPITLVALAVAPIEILRYTLYALLAVPLQPLIRALGWVYRDKPMFLTYPAAVLTAVVWGVVLYLALSLLRKPRQSRAVDA